MAGGIWTSENKILPGVYINVKSQPSTVANIGDRGVVAIPKALSWGAPGAVIEITPGEDTTALIGYPVTDSHARFLLEMMKGTDVSACPKKIYVYRYSGGTGGGTKAAASGSETVESDTLTYTIEAKYPGVRGNDLSVTGVLDPDTGGMVVSTFLDGYLVGSETISEATAVINEWCNITLEGSLVDFTATLAGGVDPVPTVNDDAAAITALETYTWDILCYDGTTPLTIAAYVAFVKRMNESIGRKCQLVIGNTPGENSPYVISVRNGVTLNDGTVLTAEQATWWVAGAEAGANYNQSLTYAQYPGAVAANPKLTDDETAAAIEAGQIAIIDEFDTVKICSDINSKTTITTDEGAEFKKNRVMRVLMTFCNDVYKHFATYFIGKVDNNAAGRSLLRAWIIGYLNEMQANNGVQNFVADDVEVLPGATIDAVVINVALQPTDSVEKVYVSVTVSVNANA